MRVKETKTVNTEIKRGSFGANHIWCLEEPSIKNNYQNEMNEYEGLSRIQNSTYKAVFTCLRGSLNFQMVSYITFTKV